MCQAGAAEWRAFVVAHFFPISIGDLERLGKLSIAYGEKMRQILPSRIE